MAFNYYEGWSEAELLSERRLVQSSLATGRITEVRLAGESTSTNSRDAASLELTLTRIAYALYLLYMDGQTEDRVYQNPHGDRITPQSHY
jgi:hypothetical protein